MMILVFDHSIIGFARWCRRRLELLGYKVVIPPTGVMKHDMLLEEYAERVNGIIVTTDKSIKYKHKVLLDMPTDKKPKYEKWYTELIKKLSNYKTF